MSRDAKKVKQECEFMMPVSVRSADRVANGNKYAGKTDVGFTVGVAQIAKKVEKTTQFWDLARSYQKSIEEITDETTKGFIHGGYDPINLGRNPFSDWDDMNQITPHSLNFSQNWYPYTANSIGPIWPIEINGRATFQMEYSKIWSDEDGQKLLDVFIDTLLNVEELTTLEEFIKEMGDRKTIVHKNHK